MLAAMSIRIAALTTLCALALAAPTALATPGPILPPTTHGGPCTLMMRVISGQVVTAKSTSVTINTGSSTVTYLISKRTTIVGKLKAGVQVTLLPAGCVTPPTAAEISVG